MSIFCINFFVVILVHVNRHNHIINLQFLSDVFISLEKFMQHETPATPVGTKLQQDALAFFVADHYARLRVKGTFIFRPVRCSYSAQLRNSDPLSVWKFCSLKGAFASSSFNCPRMAWLLLFQTARFSVHPLNSSVNVSELTQSPAVVSPQCATVSASTTPGFPVSGGPPRVGTCPRSNVPGRVVARPLRGYRTRTGCKTRSNCAGLIASRSEE